MVVIGRHRGGHLSASDRPGLSRTAFPVLPAQDNLGQSSRTLQKSSSAKKRRKKSVRLVPPTAPAARDEGPRLIPLDEKREDPSLGKTGEYYSKLAEKLLRTRK